MIFDYNAIRPFDVFGFKGNFWSLHIDIVLATWIAMGILFVLTMLIRQFMDTELNIVTVGVEKGISFFINLCKESFGHFNYDYFVFITTIFFFTVTCCVVGVLPYVEEATKDINTTLALALTSFFYVQYQKIRVHGVKGFLREFIEPFFILAPIHVVGELSKIASMSFRLFGNILGGGYIVVMVMEKVETFKGWFLLLTGFVLLAELLVWGFGRGKKLTIIRIVLTTMLGVLFFVPHLQIAFGLAEGMIQSFVLTMLTTTYLAMGTSHHEEEAAA